MSRSFTNRGGDSLVHAARSPRRRELRQHLRSRKWTAGIIGTGAVLSVFGVSVLAVCASPAEKMQGLVAIANLALVALGAISGSLITGQSFVDWRHGSQSQYATESVDVTRAETREITVRTSAPKHYDEDGI